MGQTTYELPEWIVTKEGYNFILPDHDEFTGSICLKDNQIEKCYGLMKKLRARCISINDEWGWNRRIKKLLFFDKIPGYIKGLELIKEGADLGNFEKFTHIEWLNIPDSYIGKIDFNNHKKLMGLYFRWNAKQLKNLEVCSRMKKMGVTFYGEKDLKNFSNFHSLTDLSMFYGGITNLSGAGNLGKIKALELSGLSKLNDISSLEKCKKTIRSLTIRDCKNLKDLDAAGQLSNLEELVIAGNVSIRSLKFISRLKKLKSGFIWADVVDKDLSWLKGKNIEYKGKLVQ
jgi:hypothetical protein